MSARVLEVTNLGRVEYEDGLELQEDLRRAVLGGEIPDQLLLLEHSPVVTVGRNAGHENLLLSPVELARRGVELHETGRGGDVTYHGPGQLVGYPVVDLKPDRRDVHRYVRDLEEVIVRTLADFGVAAGRIAGLTGVWIGDLKIAAIGVRISRWVTTHGFALNIGGDLDSFRLIVPCGIKNRGVTSLSRVLRRGVTLDEVRPVVARRFADVFEREIAGRDLASESVQVFLWRETSGGPHVLLLKRTPREGDFWQPVTGLLEKGERPLDTARREVKEETGRDLGEGDLVDLDFVRDFRIEDRYVRRPGKHPWINREHSFAARTEDFPVALSPAEHESYLWEPVARAKGRLRWNGNIRALARLSVEIE